MDRSETVFQGLVERGGLALVAAHLTRADASRLACTNRAALSALEPLLAQPPTAGAFCPVVFVAASGSAQLLRFELDRSGSAYLTSAELQATPAIPPRNLCSAKDGAPVVAKWRRNGTAWLTGVAIAPRPQRNHSSSASGGSGSSSGTNDSSAGGPRGSACARAADAASSSGFGVFVGEYSSTGVLSYSVTSSGLVPLGRHAGSPLLQTPEGVTFVGNTCYVATELAVAAIDAFGSIAHIAKLPGSDVAWGLAAWRPPRAVAATAAASAAAALHVTLPQHGQLPAGSRLDPALPALLLAVDESYCVSHYTVPPPDEARGRILALQLSADGSPPPPGACRLLTFNTVPMRRPSGLCFDASGSLWVTSMDRSLLRLAGPASASPGALMQVVGLGMLLPRRLAAALPFDVAAPRPPPGDTGGDTMLLVTVHAGDGRPGALLVLRLGVGPARQVRLERVIERHAALQQPNMMAVLQ